MLKWNICFSLIGVNCTVYSKCEKKSKQIFLQVLNEMNTVAYNPKYSDITIILYTNRREKNSLTHENVGFYTKKMDKWYVSCWSYAHVREALCQIACYFGYKENWISIHASGLCTTKDNGGVLIVGDPGCGKSTLAVLALKDKGVKYLGDEPILIKVHKDGIMMRGVFKGLSITDNTRKEYLEVLENCTVCIEDGGFIEKNKYRVIPDCCLFNCVKVKAIVFPGFVYGNKVPSFHPLNNVQTESGLKKQLFPLEIDKKQEYNQLDDDVIYQILQRLHSKEIKAYFMHGSENPRLNITMLGGILNG